MESSRSGSAATSPILPPMLPDPAAPLARAAGATLAEQLAQRFVERIDQRLLAAGARLPSVRDCASRHRVSPSTVVGAYDLLQAQGLVEARPQRGFFVRAPRQAQTQARPVAAAPAPAPVDATALIRSMFPGARRCALARHGHAARGVAGRRAAAAGAAPRLQQRRGPVVAALR